MSLTVDDLVPGDRVRLYCPAAAAYRLGQFEGIRSLILEFRTRPPSIVSADTLKTALAHDQLQFAIFLLETVVQKCATGQVFLIESRWAAAITPTRGLADGEGHPVFIKQRARAGYG